MLVPFCGNKVIEVTDAVFLQCPEPSETENPVFALPDSDLTVLFLVVEYGSRRSITPAPNIFAAAELPLVLIPVMKLWFANPKDETELPSPYTACLA
jgi:hypothetical protein